MIRIFDFIVNSAYLFKTEFPISHKMRIFFTYVFLTLISLLSNVINIKNIAFLGYQIEGDFKNCYYLFGELFVKNEYYFVSKKKNPVILDCGSNIGLSVIYFKMLFPNCIIYSFEPDPTSFAILQRNIQSNNLAEHVYLYNEAVSDRTMVIDFYTETTHGSLIASTQRGRVNKKITVQAQNLAEFIKDTHFDFMKMDIEGSEIIVMNELNRKNKLKQISKMTIEYHHHVGTEKDQFGIFLSLLERSGFSYQIDTRNVPIHKSDKFQDILVIAYNRYQ